MDAVAENPADPGPDAAAAPPVSSVLEGSRDLALAVIAIVATVFALKWAQGFFISLLLGILFAYTLGPLVAWLERIRVPRVVGTSIVMAGVVSALAFGSYSLRDEVQTILDQLPEAATKVSAAVASLNKGQASNLQKVETAASEIEKATSAATGQPGKSRRQATHVVIDSPGSRFGNFLWVGSMGAAAMLGQATMVLFLTFFLLLSGDIFKRKLVRVTGPSLSKRKITVRILDDINDSIQRYMLMLLATNVLVGLLTWLALHWIGLENAGAWAVAAGLLHVIPYLGPVVTAAAMGMAAFMQFGELSAVLLVVGASAVIAVAVGFFGVTWMTGRIAKMNTAAVFISLLFWGWLWGIWGMLLSVPITVIVKVVAQHVEQLEPVSELLGD
ncbi:MAG: AI-2E family transporter [Rhodocyclales bacterium]|nr:AI-2E family transporter [Rhodocyclales bacterium]